MRQVGTTQEGDRLALISEGLLDALIEAYIENEGTEVDVEWGGPVTATLTFFEPSLTITRPPDEADPLSLIEVGD